MKFVISLSAITLISLASFAGGQRLDCVNEAHSALTFSLSLNQNEASLTFGKFNAESETERDLVGKSLNLILNNEASVRGYLEYDGAVLANAYYREYRDVEIRVAKSELEKKSGIRVLMAPSNSYSGDEGGMAFQQYGMTCELE